MGGSWGLPGVQRSPWSLFADQKRLPHPLPHLLRGPTQEGRLHQPRRTSTGRCLFRKVTSTLHEESTKVENGQGRGFGQQNPISRFGCWLHRKGGGGAAAELVLTTKLSVTRKVLYLGAALVDSHWPHKATERLKFGSSDGGTEF